MAINRRKSRVQPKPAKKSYTKKAVTDAYREVQGKMRKESNLISKYAKQRAPLVGVHKMQDLGMKARAKRTKAISAAAKKHGVPKSQITALKPINPGETASFIARGMQRKGYDKKTGRYKQAHGDNDRNPRIRTAPLTKGTFRRAPWKAK
tara:strand:- start:346 stop:795 length:450 start_codon:yes stop_codon:yes gene_type:complete